MVNENKWGLLYCPRGGWRSNKRWEKEDRMLYGNDEVKEEDQEVHQIIDQIENNVEKYEHTNM